MRSWALWAKLSPHLLPKEFYFWLDSEVQQTHTMICEPTWQLLNPAGSAAHMFWDLDLGLQSVCGGAGRAVPSLTCAQTVVEDFINSVWRGCGCAQCG